MNNNYSQSSRPGLVSGRRWLLLLSLVFLTANVFGQARNYQFGQSTAAYTEIAGGTTSTATGDDGTQVLPLPFPFTYAGTAVTDITIGTNGFVRMAGGSIFSSNWTNTIESTASLPVLAPFWDDHHLVAASGTIVYETSGSAPNRQFSIEFRDVVTSGSGSSTATSRARFKVILFETSNEIVYHYGTSTPTTTLSGSIGMNSAPGGAGQFLSVIPGTVATVSTATPINNLVTLPDSGVVYTFTPSPASCAMPWAITSAAVTQSGFSLNWRNAGSTSYQYVVSTSAAVPTGAGTAVSDTFATVSGLTASTPYYVYVRSVCAGGTNSAWAGPVAVTTGGPVSSIASGLWSNPATWSTGAVPTAASIVTIAAADSVIFDLTAGAAESLTINGVLGVNAAAARALAVGGNINIAASGSINWGVPTTGTSLRILELTGNFTNAGNSNMASGNAAIRFAGSTAQTFTNTGALTNSAVGQLIINNAAGVTLASPVTIGFNLDLVAGVFNVGNNLTFDQVAVNTTSSQIRRSPLGSMVGTPTFTSTVFNLQYVFFTGQTSALITEGPEVPASRSINALTISNPAGLNLTGDLTVNAATSALVLTSGVINLPAGGKIICTATGFAPTVGSATSYVNGGVQITASTTANTTRNFPVGSAINGVPSRAQVVMANINTGGTPVTISVMPVGAPSGSGVSPVTATMGERAFEIQASGSTGTGTTVQMNWTVNDNLNLGTLAQVRVAQSPALTGPWTARSASATTGNFAAAGVRTTTAVDFANGSYFAWSTIAASDLTASALVSPAQGNGCFSGNQQVSAVIRNLGGDYDRATGSIVVSGSVTGPNGTVSLGSVTRATGIHPAGASDTIVFTTQANLAAMGNYVFEIIIDSLAGQIRTNDTLRSTVVNHVYTAEAIPANILINNGSSLKLSSATDEALISAVRFTEVVLFSTGLGQTAPYPASFPTADFDMVELTNLGSDTADLSNFQVEVLGSGPRVYTFPFGVKVAPGAVLNLFMGTGTDNPAAGIYWTGGTNAPWGSGGNIGLILRNAAGNIADALATNAYVFPVTSGVQPFNWSGLGASSPSGAAGSTLVGADLNNGSNWRGSNVAPMNVGSNVGVSPVNLPAVSWTGPGGFTATGVTATIAPRANAAVEQYVATVSYGSCVKTDTAVLNVLLPVPPVVAFSISDSVATYGATVTTVTLADSSTNVPTNWKWTVTPASGVVFVNGTADTTQNAQIQFTAPGIYSVKLRVSNPAGADSLTIANAISVNVVYCASGATNTADTKIDSVILGSTITGTAESLCEGYTNYADSLGIAATILKTQPFAMSVKSGYCGTSSYTAYGRVFIDLNRDGQFDADEAVSDFGPLTATGSGAARQWFNLNVVVPATADTGVTRMRIVWREGVSTSTAITGCGTYTYGETEDYTVRLTNPALTSSILTAPANNTFLNVDGSGATSASITWTPALSFTGATSISYAWQLAARAAGNFNTPLVTIPANNSGADTALTLNFTQIDATLASLSVPVGDTVRGIWRVRAIAGTDTSYSSNTWNIDIRRGTVTDPISAFALLTPPNFTILPIVGAGSQTAQVRWTTADAGGQPVTYQWLAIAPGGNFNTPVVALNANGNGSDTSLTLTYAAVDALLASLNFNVGDSVYLDWTVRATSGSFTRLATQTWRITLYRGGIAPLRLAVAPVFTNANTGTRGPTGASNQAFLRVATIVTKAEMAAASIDSGTSLANVALRATTGAAAAVRGKMTMYLRNASDTVSVYSRGAAWTGAIQGLSIVHDDSLTVRTTPGLMTIPFTQPFVYTGGAIEIAFEWAASAPFAATGAGYAANVAIVGSSAAAQSATAFPANLTITTNNQFRPELTWGADDRKANEVEVVTLFAKGRNPLTYGTPEVIQAIVRNNGYANRTNLPVTLNIAGANTFTNVQTIANLAPDSTQLVTFSAFTGTALGFNNMTVSIPADENNANNTKTWAQQQTDSIFSYNDTVTVGIGAVGFQTGNPGLLLTRFSINGTRSVVAARIRIGTGATTAGNSVYAVVTNDSGVIVAQSGTVALTTAELGTWVVFPFPTPVNITNGNFFIGLAQPTIGYGPVAFQAESPTRANAYFTAPLAGGVPSQVGGFRLMIEAHVGPEFIPADTLSRFNLVAPANNTTLNIQGDPTQTAQIRWRTSTRTGGVGTTTYEWLLDVPAGDFSNPVLRVNAGADTSLTLTYGQIVDSLAAKGVPVGGSFAGRWTVRAINGPVNRLANIPFTITINRGVMTSIEETDFSKAISLYPNPAAYTAKLQVNVPGEKVLSVVIVNAVGQEMKKFQVSSSVANDMELDLSNLNQGLYFVRVSDGNEMAIKRLMIQR